MSTVSGTSGSTLAISGLVSGLDTDGLINSLVSLDARQQTLLTRKQSAATALSTALKSLNAKNLSLQAAAETAAKPESWTSTKATSSATSVTATASRAVPASVTFSVTALASAQSSLAVPPTDASATPSFTITRADGTSSTVTAVSSDVLDVVDALNDPASGVRASAVNVGTASAPSYRLQLTGSTTGAQSSFSVSYTTGAGTSAALALQPIRAAGDATITLFPGTGAQQTLTQASNTFTGLMSGVDVTISAVEEKPVTVSVAPDTDARKKLATSLVSNLNLVMGEITSQTAVKSTTGTDGATKVTGGVLSGNTAVRALQQSLLGTASGTYGGASIARIGLTLGRDGTFTLDENALTAALAADPDTVQTVLSGLATAVAGVTKAAGDSVSGTLTSEVKGQDALVRDLGQRIADWDDRLATRRAALQKQYAALEVALQKTSSQSSWLSAQLASMSSTTG